RTFDRLGRPFDLDEIVHPRVALEPHDGSMELVLPDLAVDLHRDDEAESVENLREALRVSGDVAVQLLARLVRAARGRRPLPVERRSRDRAGSGAVDAQA